MKDIIKLLQKVFRGSNGIRAHFYCAGCMAKEIMDRPELFDDVLETEVHDYGNMIALRKPHKRPDYYKYFEASDLAYKGFEITGEDVDDVRLSFLFECIVCEEYIEVPVSIDKKD